MGYEGVVKMMENLMKSDNRFSWRNSIFSSEVPRNEGLAINIVHTNLDNKQLQDNQVLLRQLNYILDHENEFYHIQILMNGSDSYQHIYQLVDSLFHDLSDEIEYYSVDTSSEHLLLKYHQTVISFLFVDNILPLGSARDYLAGKEIYRRYINVDEDDEFVDAKVVRQLLSVLPKLEGYAVAMFGFRWYYLKNGWVTYKDNPCLNEESLVWDFSEIELESPIRMDSMKGLCSWNLVHDADYYSQNNITRPPVNKYDDCFFYNRILDHIQNIAFIQLNVYAYHAERANMSKTPDAYMNAITEYINRDKYFYVTKIITP